MTGKATLESLSSALAPIISTENGTVVDTNGMDKGIEGYKVRFVVPVLDCEFDINFEVRLDCGF